MSLEIKTKEHSNHHKVSLIGKCTIYTVTKLRAHLIEIIEKNQNILIDLEKVTDFDTAGLQIFVAVKNTARLTQKKVKFVAHPACVIALLDLYGLTSFFGDKIILTSEEKKHFTFRYGIKKHSTVH